VPKLPPHKPQEVIRKLKRFGFKIDHQTGGHAILYKKGQPPISVPVHNRDLKTGTLHSIIKQAGINTQEFLKIRK